VNIPIKLFPRAASRAVLVVVTALAVALPADARVSLSEIDQKLDAVLAALDADVTPDTKLVSVRVSRNVANEGSNLLVDVFEVPAGKVLVVDFLSMFLDVVVRNEPSTGVRIRGTLIGANPQNPSSAQVRFDLGYMDRYLFTSRGTPNFTISGQIPVYFGAGTVRCLADTRFGGVDLDFGLAECSISGRLIDAPEL